MKSTCRFFALLMVTTLSAALVLAQTPTAEKVSVPFSDPARPGKLRVNLMSGGITVRGYAGKDVVIEAHSRAGESRRDRPRTDGLRRIDTGASGLSVEEENNVMHVGTGMSSHPVDFVIQVPAKTSLSLKTMNDGSIKVENVQGEIEVSSLNGSVTLTNISGSAVAHALNGKVLVTFLQIDPQKSMSFSSMNGDIDVSLPADTKANVRIKTDRGDVLSDFDIKLQEVKPVVEDTRANKGKYVLRIDRTVQGTINGGGPEYQFKNVNGDVIIRKAAR